MSRQSAEAASTHHSRGIALCLTSMLVFASQDGITKFLVKEFSVAQLLMVRYWVFVVCVVGYLAWKGELRGAVRSKLPGLQVVRSLLALGEAAIFGWGLKYLGLADCHALFAVFPLLTLALAGVFLGEFIGLRHWVAALVGFVGTLVILRPGFGIFDPAALIPLLAATTFAVYNLLSRRISQTDSFATNMLYMAVIGAIASTCFGVPAWQAPTPAQWGLLGVYAVAGMTGHLLLIKALEFAPAAVLQPFNYSLLVFATLVGLLVFGEFPDLHTIAGGLLILAGGIYAVRAR
ncbi:DMT family transporter [Pseudomonas mediterranea]|uniref:DMT family transporter n=1 Tax=Pseudomonas mediterranea TaxID=183795 RepID=UPI00191EC1BD|nr:DMT family transporter [Pseudomonas mediterranea]MBL0845940.1 DMT family transporter [Pseudomonas mediterranea]